jgi:hypothetical protein
MHTKYLLPGERIESDGEEVAVKEPHVPVVVFDAGKIQKVTSQSRNGFMVGSARMSNPLKHF